MSYFIVLVTEDTEFVVTFVLYARHEPSARLATPLTFAHRFPIRCASLVFRETRGVSKVPMAVVAGDSNLPECARRTNPAIATRLVADVRDVTFTRLAASFTHIPFRHGTGKFRYGVIISFDLIIKYSLLGELPVLRTLCLHSSDRGRRLYYPAESVPGN